MNNTKSKALEFLYQWTNRNVIAQVKKGMVEELEAFVLSVMAEDASQRSALRMKASSEDPAEKNDKAQGA
jgi:hypothetical protein